MRVAIMKLRLKLGILLFACGILFGLGTIASQTQVSSAKNLPTLHMLNRLTFGPTTTEIKQIESQGFNQYLKAQLHPESIPESPQLEKYLAKQDILKLSPLDLDRKYGPNKKLDQLSPSERNRVNKNVAKIKEKAIQSRLYRSIASRRQLQEVMVDFWFNHFNVYMGKGVMGTIWVPSYEQDAIRPYALGKFRDLLGATTHHPEMLIYLDNWLNTDPNSKGAKGEFKGLNENYARELMELHTLGVDGGYSQKDVVALAKILTGWGIDRTGKKSDGNGFYFWKNRHDFSDKILLGKTIKGSGAQEVEQALDILARHPSTARHISYKLAQYFVADEPPASLVERLSKSFQATDGDIKSVLTSLFTSPEFLDNTYAHNKFKTPYQYVISAARLTEPEKPNLRRIAGVLIQMGMPVYGCPTPDGYKNTKEAWLNSDSMTRRVTWAIAISRNAFDLSKNHKIESTRLAQNLGNNFSTHTKQVIEASQPKLRSALILASPEMMHR
jgi:uncharacterized protein (DUF1800 family)